MQLKLKNVRTHRDISQETECFSAIVYADGKRVGRASNEGQGGPHRIEWYDREAGKAVDEWADKQPTQFEHEKLDQIIDALLAHECEREQIKRWCRQMTVFRLKDDQPGAWRTIKRKYDAAVKAHLVKKHGARLERIANEGI